MQATQSDIFVANNDLDWETVGEGVRRKILGYDGGLMLVRVLFDAGGVGPTHDHPHRQVTYVESGTFDVTIDGRTQTLHAGDSFFVPPHAPHGAVCREAGCLIDVFTPAREDFLQ